MTAAVDVLRDRVAVPILAQSDLPKPALIEAFQADEPTCLFATLGFWQGVDIPGPHPEPGDHRPHPLPPPRRPGAPGPPGPGRAGGLPASVDLPRAGTLLAQGAGRLIRSADDRGVVAVLDSRLATASYRGALLARVPPMKRTVDRRGRGLPPGDHARVPDRPGPPVVPPATDNPGQDRPPGYDGGFMPPPRPSPTLTGPAGRALRCRPGR